MLTIVGMFTIIICASMFSACSQDVYEDESGSVSYELSLRDSLSSAMTRASGSTSLGYEYISPDDGYVDATTFTFTLSSISSLLANNRVHVFVMFYAPLGGVYPVEMQKNILNTGVSCVLYRELSQIGKYKVKFACTVDNANPITDGIYSGTEYDVLTYIQPINVQDDYPYANYNSNNTDPWNFYYRYCTSWVAWKVNQMWNTSTSFCNTMHNVTLGNASNWKSALETIGYESDSNPRNGDIAYWSSNHVAFVNEVVSNNEIVITEYNNPSAGASLSYHTRTILRSSSSWPTAFIHVQNQI